MSENRIINSRLLENLDVTSFLGRILTTTDEEITECFTKDFPPPTAKQLAAGPVGTLSKLEMAAMVQASKTTTTIIKMTDDFIELTTTDEFKRLAPTERKRQLEVVTATTQKLTQEVRDYVELSQELTTERLPHVDTDISGYYLCSDGSFYDVAGGQSAAETVSPREPSSAE